MSVPAATFRRFYAAASLLAATCLVFGLIVAPAQAQPLIDPGPLASFDGRSWSGLILDSTTKDALKKNFKTQGAKGNDKFLRSEAIIMTPPALDEDGDIKAIQAMMSGNGGDAKLLGIRLVYGDYAPMVADLARDLNRPMQRFYPNKRYSNWYIVAFPQRGIAAITTDDNGNQEERVLVALLTSPVRLQRALTAFSTSPTPISNIQDDMRVLHDYMEVGGVEINLSINGFDRFDSWRMDSMRRDLRDQLRDRLSRSNIRVTNGGRGQLRVDVTVNYNSDSDGSITCNGNADGVVYRAAGPQNVTAQGAGYESLPKRRSDAEDALRWKIGNAANSMLSNLGSNVRGQIKRLQPPSPEDYRRGVWDDIVNKATR